MTGRDYLAEILERKHGEVARRRRHAAARATYPLDTFEPPPDAVAALRRPPGDGCRIVAEVKFRSPSAGQIRQRSAGEGVRVARSYVDGGAHAVSVLADEPGFGGCPLGVRRVARAVSVPVLFKEFVLDEVQVDLARRCGASMVLLLVRALSPRRLRELADATRALGMSAVVEAADLAELDVAVACGAPIVGVNARDLRTFTVDGEAAARAMEHIPPDRVAVFMSGIRSREDVVRVESTRADAVLVGESLMREADPGAKLRSLGGTT